MAKVYYRRMVILWAILILCLISSVGLGRYAIDPFTVIKILLSKVFPISAVWPEQAGTVLFQIRFPRVLMGCVIGAGLACAGCAYQGIFQNPMASPDILGASNGAGFGAAFALFIGLSYSGISLMALTGGLCAVGVAVFISARAKGNRTLSLILSGIMVGSLASAGISYLKLVADPTDTLPAITYWLMGSLASIRNQDVLFAAPLVIAGILPILLLRWKISVLTMGDEEAASMGVNAARLRFIVVVCATLVIPHFTRMLVGSDFRRTLPASLLVGGSFMLIVDDFARLVTTSEIPIGILTAFVGVPFFLYLIVKEGNRL